MIGDASSEGMRGVGWCRTLCYWDTVSVGGANSGKWVLFGGAVPYDKVNTVSEGRSQHITSIAGIPEGYRECRRSQLR